jgi:signal transduction histidine kinase
MRPADALNAMASSPFPEPVGETPLRPRLLIRVAAWFYIGGGALTLATVPLPTPRPIHRPALAAVSIAGVIVGVLTLVVPWERWSFRTTLVLVVLAFALIALGNAFGDGDPYSYGIFFLLVFVWIGLAHPRVTSVAIAPFGAVAYSIPLAARGELAAHMSSVVLTFSLCVLVGESLAIVTARLRRTESMLREREQRSIEAYERERAAGERLRQLDEMKRRFLRAVSHEIRTPLSVILGGALTLERSDSVIGEGERREIARSVAHKARKLDEMLQDLLDVDRLARGVLLPRRRLVDVAAIAFRVVEESGILSDRSVTLDLRPAVGQLDGAQVQRIVENLISNAVKHTRDDSSVWVRTLQREDVVEIVVEDDGPGVDAAVREQLFRPFAQGTTGPAHAPGVGIGLALVGRFAEIHGGRAWAAERHGGGASFHVLLPNAPAPPHEDRDERAFERVAHVPLDAG